MSLSYRKVLFIVAPLLFLSLMLPQKAFSEDTANCLACHSAMKGKVQTAGGALIELNVDVDKFQSSVHGSLSCTECHIKFSDNPHTTPAAPVSSFVLAVSSKISSKHSVDPIAAAACSNCHEEIYRKVMDSVHGSNIAVKKQKDGALCLDCHGSPHYITKADKSESGTSRKNQTETCGKCHGDKEIIEKYKLQENVMKSFKDSFHGRKLYLGHTTAPGCASCHNAHDIKSKNDPTSPVVGKNKLVTCGKCHPGANEKFVPAITHVEPHPIAHYTEKGLIVLTLGTFAFIILHVLLDAFSEIRDAVFRKRREEE
jgi:hypothetical protein